MSLTFFTPPGPTNGRWLAPLTWKVLFVRFLEILLRKVLLDLSIIKLFLCKVQWPLTVPRGKLLYLGQTRLSIAVHYKITSKINCPHCQNSNANSMFYFLYICAFYCRSGSRTKLLPYTIFYVEVLREGFPKKLLFFWILSKWGGEGPAQIFCHLR